ncbi:FHA domain-containing protein [bacterium]|nr:FHA domain-containing protein [candidate division CSSED10-310 bacterium]
MDQQAREEARWASRKHFAFKGFIEVIPLSDIFNLLHLGNRTGCLLVSRDQRTCFVYLKDGAILCISSAGDRWRLMEAMLQNLQLTQTEKNELQDLVKGRDAVLPDLVTQGLLTREKLDSIARRFYLQEICGLFLWSKGEFEFLDHKLAPDDLPAMEIEVPFAVMEAMRNLDSIRRAVAWLEDDEAVPQLRSTPLVDEETVTLAMDEWRLISYMDGISPVAEICARAVELGDYRVYKAILCLAERGLVKEAEAGMKRRRLDPRENSERIKSLAEQTLHGGELRDGLPTDLLDEHAVKSHDPVQATVTLMRGDRLIREFFLNTKGAQIGRSESCDIVLKNDPTISRLHARVGCSEQGFTVHDLNSANGIFVNSKKVTERLLRDGDIVQVGGYTLHFSLTRNND